MAGSWLREMQRTTHLVHHDLVGHASARRSLQNWTFSPISIRNVEGLEIECEEKVDRCTVP